MKGYECKALLLGQYSDPGLQRMSIPSGSERGPPLLPLPPPPPPPEKAVVVESTGGDGFVLRGEEQAEIEVRPPPNTSVALSSPTTTASCVQLYWYLPVKPRTSCPPLT